MVRENPGMNRDMFEDLDRDGRIIAQGVPNASMKN
jgi:hypothetical protein